jgi:D-sedoheptulose 7-phosphate isomerase
LSAEIQIISNYLDEASALMEKSKSLARLIDLAAELISTKMHTGGKILLCGNGGSAADAQHIAAEFVGQYLTPRKPLPALAITTDSSILTAIGNDFGFDSVFSRQIQAMSLPNDVVVCYSTSGRSQNILKAIEISRQLGLGIVNFSSERAPRVRDVIDIRIPSSVTPQIQQLHLTLSHVLCEIVEIKLNKLNYSID